MTEIPEWLEKLAREYTDKNSVGEFSLLCNEITKRDFLAGALAVINSGRYVEVNPNHHTETIIFGKPKNKEV